MRVHIRHDDDEILRYDGIIDAFSLSKDDDVTLIDASERREKVSGYLFGCDNKCRVWVAKNDEIVLVDDVESAMTYPPEVVRLTKEARVDAQSGRIRRVKAADA